jgi:multiple sugar transport system substrate-binding protein
MSDDQVTLFGRPIDRRALLTLTGKVLAGSAVVGMWLSPELAQFVDATARGRKSGGSIRVMNVLYNPGTPARWQAFTDQLFTKETGIKVIWDNVIYNNQYQKITTQGQAGTHGYDVVQIDTIWTGSFAGAGFTLDLTGFLPASVTKHISAPALAAVSYKSRAYGVPQYNSAKHFYYNKKMLDKVGLKRPPATLDELLQYCEILKRNKGKLGIQYPMSWSWKQAEGLTCDFVQMTDSLGGRFYATDNVTPVFNKGAGVKALAMMKLMLDKGYAASGSLSHTENDVEDDLLSGKIAMATDWEGPMADSRDPSRASTNVRGQIRMALIPGSAVRKSGSCLGPEGWAIMKSSVHQAAAKAFLNWYVSLKAQKEQALRFNYPPIYSALYTDPTLRRLIQHADGVDDFPIYGEQFDYSQPRPNFPGYLDASQRLQVHLHRAFLGSETPQKALDAAAAEMKAATGGGNNP